MVGNATGVTNLVNCVSHPSLGQCLEAAGKIGLDAVAVASGGASEGLELAGEEAAEAATEEAAEDATADAASDSEDAVEQGCGESFTAVTKVLLASGAAIPISQLKAGDWVLATSVKTGKTSPEIVTAVMVKHDTDRYDLEIRAGHLTAVIDTTSRHQFWDVTRGRWVWASHLHIGDRLHNPDGATITVVGGYTPRNRDGWMWDITAPGGGDHDFYIDTATADVLVHNCSPGERIANGHAFVKHVVEQGEFPGIRTRSEFADIINDMIENGESKALSAGRMAYWWKGTVVAITNPAAADFGTAFAPTQGYDYFLGLG